MSCKADLNAYQAHVDFAQERVAKLTEENKKLRKSLKTCWQAADTLNSLKIETDLWKAIKFGACVKAICDEGLKVFGVDTWEGAEP